MNNSIAQFPSPEIPLKLTVEENALVVADLFARPWVSENLRTSLEQATVVFVQWEGFRDLVQPVFPTHTAELFRYLQTHLPPEIRSEVAVDDEVFTEVSLHADIVWLPDLLVKGGSLVALPIAINLISEWLKLLLLERRPRTEAKLNVTIELPTGEIKRLVYEGPADELGRITELGQRLLSSALPSHSLPAASVLPALPEPGETTT